MANIIVVCGPQAVGKMTVAESLRDKLRYNMMINHDSIEVIAHDVFVHCSLGTLDHKRSTLTAMAEELADYYFVKTGRQSVKTVSS